ncbi:DUF6233 domain-containing protein [Streptomyces flaveolus]|uniref:DUF6233 domain-containing protein n=1 Tax=Streptomyces flaveolus TaxID=67297 RepID=UPI0034189D3E
MDHEGELLLGKIDVRGVTRGCDDARHRAAARGVNRSDRTEVRTASRSRGAGADSRRWRVLGGPAQLDGWIAEEERREAERRRGEELRPPPPEWLLQAGLNRANTDAVHAGDCWAAAKSGRCRPVSREQAQEALRHGIPACVHCRPDTALGLLE